MSQVQYINPASIAAPPGNFSWIVQHGDVLWFSGMVAIGKSGEFVGAGDSEKQARQIYENIEAALKERGGSLDSLVKTVTYVVGREHQPGVQRVRKSLRETGRLTKMPAGVLVLVAGLASEEYLVEVEAVAVIA